MRHPLKMTGQVVALALVAGLLGLLVWKLMHQTHAPRVGTKAPAFTLAKLTGPGHIDLAEYRGRPVVLNFWASWCVPCKSEAAVLERAWLRYRAKGVAFVGVDFHDVAGDARRFVSVHGLTFPMAEDGSGNITTGEYGVTQVPETYVVGRTGKIIVHIAGPITAAGFSTEFERGLVAALRT